MSRRSVHVSLGAPRELSLPGRIGATVFIALALAFVALPIVAIMLRVSLSSFVDQVTSPAVRDALVVSIRTSFIAHVFVLAFGTPLAYVLARRRFRGRDTIVTVLELPIMLPPAVAGIGLLAAFGRSGLLGYELAAFGITIPFTQGAVVLAIIFVSGPFYLRQAIAAFESIDGDYIDTARTLGASPLRAFLRVAIPLALPGLEAGSALALARGFGEFGATILFAGSLQGVTQTLPLAVYALIDSNYDAALAASVLLIAFGIAVLLANRMVVAWTRSRLT